MSRENVEIVRRWNISYNQRDMDVLIKLTDPSFEFRSVFLPMESHFRGHEGLSAYFKAVEDAYERFEVIPEDYLDAGAAVHLLCRIEWRGRGSGAEGQSPVAVCAWLKAGRIFHIESYADRRDGFRAVGLSHPDAPADS